MSLSPSELICRSVNWRRTELASAFRHYQDGNLSDAALQLIRHLRSRPKPHLGYDASYTASIRAAATAEQRESSREKILAALSGDLFMPYHNNIFTVLGADALLLGADAELCDRIGLLVAENESKWDCGMWGVTHSVCELIRYLWSLEECRDDVFVPLFGWLLTKAKVEWAQSQKWSESTLGTSGHNWWTHTFSGFWMAGLFFPEFEWLEQFQAFVPDFLERELNILFESDGWSKEGAPGYAHFAASTVAEMAILATRNGIAIPVTAWQRLHSIADAGWKLMAPDGDWPAFGDHLRRPAYSAAKSLRRWAARFSLPNAKFVAEALDPDWQPLYSGILPDLGENLLPAYLQLEASAPEGSDTCLKASGYYVMRQHWTPVADWVAIEAGPLGSRITSHKHASIFNFELYCKGRRILVDNGYGSAAEYRDDDSERFWRVSSRAHNVATVDLKDHVPIPAEFLYGATVIPTIDVWHSTRHYCYFSGVHEGYRHLASPVTAHRRKLFYLRGEYWILIDRFTPDNADAHQYQQHFQIAAPSSLGNDGIARTHGEGGNLLIVPVPGLAGEPTLEPNPYPLESYENPDHLTYTRPSSENDLFVTLLVPFLNDDLPEVQVRILDITADRRSLRPWEATALEISIDGRRDVYVDQHMEWNLPWIAGGYSGTGRLSHSMLETD